MSPRDEVLELIRQNLGFANVFAVPGVFIALTGDTDSALLLSQLLYWTERARDPRGWVYKARYEWCHELHLSRHRFDTARRRLRELGLVEEAHHLVAARRILHMRFRHADLCTVLRSCLPHDDTEARMPMGQTGVDDATESAVDAPLHNEVLVRSSGFRSNEEDNPGVPDSGHSEIRIPQLRTVGERNLEPPDSGHSSTETPPETTAQTAAETSAQSAGRSAAGRDGEEGEGGGSGSEGETDRRSPEEQRELARMRYRETCQLVRRQARERRQKELSDLSCEERLFRILGRVRGFPQERDYSALGEIMEEYQDMDYEAEFARFAGYWREVKLERPWVALRRWLERAQAGASSSRRTRELAGGHARHRETDGMCHAEGSRRDARPRAL